MNTAETLSQNTASAWLATQCRMIPGVVCAAVFSRPESADEYPRALASWPETQDQVPAGLTAAAGRAFSKSEPVLCYQRPAADKPTNKQLNIACPILIEGDMQGVIAVRLDNSSKQQQRAVMQMLQWGGQWLQFSRSHGAEFETEMAARILQVVASALQETGAESAATACATELANQLGCQRVSIGLRSGRNLSLQAISNSARFDEAGNLARGLELAMMEAADHRLLKHNILRFL